MVLEAGEIRETANLINRGNIFQEISEHFLRKTRIIFLIPGEWSKQRRLRVGGIHEHCQKLCGGRVGKKGRLSMIVYRVKTQGWNNEVFSLMYSHGLAFNF
jgi:hypothetical protein